MKILLDESVPRLIKNRLSRRDIKTVQEMGWAGLKNGDLLKLAEREFDVFVTADKNFRHQQNIAMSNVACIILPSNQVPVVAAPLPAIEKALDNAKPGTLVEMALPIAP